jgi:hypothetical protein
LLRNSFRVLGIATIGYAYDYVWFHDFLSLFVKKLELRRWFRKYDAARYAACLRGSIKFSVVEPVGNRKDWVTEQHPSYTRDGNNACYCMLCSFSTLAQDMVTKIV